MSGIVEKIFIATAGGAEMLSVDEVNAVAEAGLEGDRYCRGSGNWSQADACQVTLIESEHLDEIMALTGISVSNGEHRRNLVTRGLRLDPLAGRPLQVGEAILELGRPRSTCAYIESLTERGMTNALLKRGGICARVLQSGKIRISDLLVVL